MKELVASIEAASARLSTVVLEEMYRDPFWDDRFGARGRKRAAEDGLHHLSNLAQALLAEDPAILTRYARWLQAVLTSRGLCTRHLEENFKRLADALALENMARGEEAVRYLALAEVALEYQSGPPQEIQRASKRIAARAAGLVQEHWVDEALTCLSYLVDSVALGRSETFCSYATWVSAFSERRGVPRGHFNEMIAALGEALRTDETLSTEAKTAAEQLLAVERSARIPSPHRDLRGV